MMRNHKPPPTASKSRPPLFLLLLVLGLWPLGPLAAGAAEHELLHYEIVVALDPEGHRLEARAAITVPPGYPRRFTMALHGGLAPRSGGSEVVIVPAADGGHPGPRELETFTVSLPPEVDTFVVVYGGKIHHPLDFAGQDYARGVRYTPGRIDPEGIYLGPGAFWYPQPLQRDHFSSFRLRVQLPPGWMAVSQGRRQSPRPEVAGNETVWEELNPQQGIFLVADHYTVYEDEADGIATMAFLRQPDPELARRYLEATVRYLRLYSEMLGPYPYAKFALVENSWESGFGMPSFTLLGSRVIRLPFILNSSYPHEILHNWWGNGVFTDYASGNWNEGLTAYLADHLLMVEQGRGGEYRRGVLQKYADYAAGGRDFPLRAFTARHSPAGEAVGYGKGLLFFHMLRRELGEDAFWAGLRHFYRTNLFRIASFGHLQKSFETVAQRRLDDFFAQWLERTGAPELEMSRVTLEPEEGQGWRLKAIFSQRGPAPPYRLRLPVSVTLAGEAKPRRFQVPLSGSEVSWQASFQQQPLRLELDPDFELFRRLDRREIPPAFSRLYGSENTLLVILPSGEEELLPAYRELATALGRFGSAQVEIVLDRELAELPAARDLVLLGWQNRFQSRVAQELPPLAAALLADESLRIGATVFAKAGHAFALALPHPENPAATMGWIALDQPAMLPGLIRRLPHYHRDGALVFAGDDANNILRHQWPAPDSPLAVNFPIAGPRFPAHQNRS